MSLTATLIFLATLCGGVLLVALGLRRRRIARLAAQAERDTAAEQDIAAEAITRRVGEMLGEHERRIVEAVSGLRDHLGELKSDVEWLAGERMIEQAIALAREGADPDSIGQELGLNRDTAATIALFRKH